MWSSSAALEYLKGLFGTNKVFLLLIVSPFFFYPYVPYAGRRTWGREDLGADKGSCSMEQQKFEFIAIDNWLLSLSEMDRLMVGESRLDKTLLKFITTLNSLNIPYGVIGAMALNFYGLPRFTVDIDILIRKEDLIKIHNKCLGLGYVLQFQGSKGIRDTETGVKIDFVLSGTYPGDGKEKPICFPDPSEIEIVTDPRGVRFITLKDLIELKLASGMSLKARGRDLSDVYDLIKIQKLDRDFGQGLNNYVREIFLELFESQENEMES